MSDVANLQIKVDSSGVAEAERRLRGLSGAGHLTVKATDGLSASFRGMLGPLVGVGAAAAGLTKLVSVTREFEKLNAGLITATGSATSAKIAFEALEGFAATTPYSLQQSVQAFTKLVNLGLNPSEKAMRSYGNTAASMGKDLNQMIEAVADAATGEFERLKEFGIKSKTEGDKVTFTFRGVKTTVQKEAGAIEGYLRKLGDTYFAGAMEERMKTLDGAISNLADTWDKMYREISKGDVGKFMKDAVTTATEALEGLIGFLKSGAIGNAIGEMGRGFTKMAADADLAWSSVKYVLHMGDESPSQAYARTRDTLASMEMDDARAKRRDALVAAYAAESEAFAASGSQAYEQTGGITGAYAAFAPKARAAAIAAKAKKGKGYEVPGERGRDTDFAAQAKERERELDALADKAARLSKLEADRAEAEAEASKRRKDTAKSALDQVLEGYMTEEELLQKSLGRKRKMIDEAFKEGLIAERDHAALMTKVTVEEEQRRQAMTYQHQANMMASTQALFGNLASAARNWGGEQSDAYRTMFAMQKAFAVASATVSVGKSIADAFAAGGGWASAALAMQAAAQGASVLSMISSTNYSGAYDKGGYISGGSFGDVGERDWELVRGAKVKGPAEVIGREETARMLGGQGITIVNAPTMSGAAQFARSSANRRIVLNMIGEEALTIRRALGV